MKNEHNNNGVDAFEWCLVTLLSVAAATVVVFGFLI